MAFVFLMVFLWFLDLCVLMLSCVYLFFMVLCGFFPCVLYGFYLVVNMLF